MEPQTCPRRLDLPRLFLPPPVWAGREDLLRHLKTCPLCKNDARRIEATLRSLQSAPSRELRRDLLPGIRARLASGRRARSSRFLIPSLGAAAALALFFLSGSILPRHDPEPPKPAPLAPAENLFSREGPVLGRALDWLASAQAPSGCWKPQQFGGESAFTVGITGLVLLAFLDGEAHPMNGPHADTVILGLRYLRRCIGPDGRMAPSGSALVYNQSLAILALAQDARLRRDRSLDPDFGSALLFLRSLQDDAGGFGSDHLSARPTSAASIWALSALVEGDDRGWLEAKQPARRTLRWLTSLCDTQGRLGYRAAGDHPYGVETLSAAGAFHLPGRPGLQHALSQTAALNPGDTNYLHLYFLTHALSAGPEARSSRALLLDRLANGQVDAGPQAGSWNPVDRWSSAGGRIYATAMAALALEADRRSSRMHRLLRRAW